MISVKEEFWAYYDTSKTSFDPEEYVLLFYWQGGRSCTGAIDDDNVAIDCQWCFGQKLLVNQNGVQKELNVSHYRSACCYEVSAATRDDQSRIRRIRRAVAVFGSSVEVVLAGGFLILTRSLLSKDWNWQYCLVPLFAYIRGANTNKLGTLTMCSNK